MARLAEHDASRVLARLARMVGASRMQLAEDAVQHALLQALRLWPRGGVPQAPVAWLFAVARNHMRDTLRRETRLHSVDDQLERLAAPMPAATAHFSRELDDDEVALLFTACDPVLGAEARIGFALKWICGLSVSQVAAGLLTSEAAMTKKLQRARKVLAERGTWMAPLQAGDIAPRIESVRTAMFLFFNEGYSASAAGGESACHICRESARLAMALARHPITAGPASDALAALLLLSFARLPGRLNSIGDLLPLEEQDRSSWDRELIGLGLACLARSAEGEVVSVWHLRAQIAAFHALSVETGATDWRRILAAYERLCAIDASPVAALGRAVALAQVEGAATALAAIRPVLRQLPNDPYAQAAAGKFLLDLDKPAAALHHFRHAEETARSSAERRLMRRYIEAAERRG